MSTRPWADDGDGVSSMRYTLHWMGATVQVQTLAELLVMAAELGESVLPEIVNESRILPDPGWHRASRSGLSLCVDD
jgi:hypothetical protein